MKKMRNVKEKQKNTDLEDTTKNGENVASMFNWITLDKQKEKAREMNNMTKRKNVN